MSSIRWFKVTFLSRGWRSLNPWKGHLTIPKRSQRIARELLLYVVGCFLLVWFILFWKLAPTKHAWDISKSHPLVWVDEFRFREAKKLFFTKLKGLETAWKSQGYPLQCHPDTQETKPLVWSTYHSPWSFNIPLIRHLNFLRLSGIGGGNKVHLSIPMGFGGV